MINAIWCQNFKVRQSLPFLPFSVIRIGGLNSSVILTSLDYNNYTGKLLSYLEPVFLSSERSRFVKCWHAETDGWAASTFHSKCDGRGPTVTIIKVNDYIFGGYTDVSWSGGRDMKFVKRGQDNFIGSTIVPLGMGRGRGGGKDGVGGNLKGCSSDKSSYPLLFHVNY